MEFVIIWIACAIAGGAITSAKNRGFGVGLAWGGLLGIIGLIVCAALPSKPAV